jgi:hypothetical protein
VAAGLTGSLATLLLNPSTTQPVASQVTISNAGQVAPVGPAARTSWQIAPAPDSARRAYVLPGGPPLAGAIQWTVNQACAIHGPGAAPFAKRRMQIVAIPSARRVYISRHGRHQIAIKINRVPWQRSIRMVGPGCAMLPLRCRMAVIMGQGPRIAPVIIKRHGRVVIIRPGRHAIARHVHLKARAGKRVSVVLPGAQVSAVPAPQCVALRRAPGR